VHLHRAVGVLRCMAFLLRQKRGEQQKGGGADLRGLKARGEEKEPKEGPFMQENTVARPGRCAACAAQRSKGKRGNEPGKAFTYL